MSAQEDAIRRQIDTIDRCIEKMKMKFQMYNKKAESSTTTNKTWTPAKRVRDVIEQGGGHSLWDVRALHAVWRGLQKIFGSLCWRIWRERRNQTGVYRMIIGSGRKVLDDLAISYQSLDLRCFSGTLSRWWPQFSWFLHVDRIFWEFNYKRLRATSCITGISLLNQPCFTLRDTRFIHSHRHTF